MKVLSKIKTYILLFGLLIGANSSVVVGECSEDVFNTNPSKNPSKEVINELVLKDDSRALQKSLGLKAEGVDYDLIKRTLENRSLVSTLRVLLEYNHNFTDEEYEVLKNIAREKININSEGMVQELQKFQVIQAHEKSGVGKFRELLNQISNEVYLELIKVAMKNRDEGMVQDLINNRIDVDSNSLMRIARQTNYIEFIFRKKRVI